MNPLTTRTQLVGAILKDREVHPDVDKKRTECPFGTVIVRNKYTGEIYSMTQVFSVGSQIFSSGEGEGFYHKYQPCLRIGFVGETMAWLSIKRVEYDLEHVDVLIKD